MDTTATDIFYGEPSAEFYRQFPDGIVPINCIPMGTLDVDAWPRWLALRDALAGYDIDRIEDLASQWRVLRDEVEVYHPLSGEFGEDSTAAAEAAIRLRSELRSVTIELLGLGLSMRGLADYLDTEPLDIAVIYSRFADTAPKTLAADALIEDVNLTSREIALRSGLSERRVRALRQMRGIKVPRGGRRAATTAA